MSQVRAMESRPLLSIIVPVLNESEVLQAFYDRVKSVVESLDSYSYEIVFIDDGSRDSSCQQLICIANSDSNVRIIKFSRNFGHQAAITAGIEHAKGDAVVIIDADLQDPPETIPEFVAKWEEGYDVVYGVREERHGEGRMKLLTASFFYRILRSLVKIEIPVDAGDFRLMSARAAGHFREFRERDRFVRGLVSWLGFKQVGVPYRREKRYAGKTKYPYRKMLQFAVDGITAFSHLPLKLASWLGYFASFVALVYACVVLVQKFLGITVQGWATIMISILFFGGVQLICMGILGEYIGRIFNEVKQRPLYIIQEMYSFENAHKPEMAPLQSARHGSSAI